MCHIEFLNTRDAQPHGSGRGTVGAAALRPKTHLNNGGFTLLEVLISMVVLAVVLSAITLMNYTSLASFSSARDSTEGTYVGQKTITMLLAESEQWSAAPSPTGWTGPTMGVYRDDHAFGTTPLLSRIMSASNLQWVSLDDNLPFASTGDSAQQQLGRFCVAARRIELPNTAPSGIHAIRIQIAVYRPGPAQHLIDSCATLNGGNLQNLSLGAKPGEQLLRTLGTRVEFFSTIITPPAPY